MDSRGTTKLWSRTQKTIAHIVLLIPISAVIVALLLINSPTRVHHHSLAPTVPGFPLHSFIKEACPETLYSSLCRSTLSNMSTASNEFASFVEILQFTINRTAENVTSTRNGVDAHFKNQDLNSHEKNALEDCIELLDQTMYELQQVIESLRLIPLRNIPYGNIKTLLSAAMTNENTCIDGFADLEELNFDSQKGHRQHLQTLLTPISQMISNTLGLIKYGESKQNLEAVRKPRMMITKRRVAKMPTSGGTIRGRQKAIMNPRPHVTVSSSTARGGYITIGEAIAGAPNMSRSVYVIKIMAGVYSENVLVPREKTNIMLIGDGMNSTIITGSRSFADGFSTFASATLTVIGDRFMARDLTIRNTAAPEKHQAVALRVTSNAAFYRCEIISHQDTLYAHSLSQFYQNCSIQGTVDFIFGNAAAVFHNCKILVRKPILGQRNMITAQGREDPNQNTGISLQNCTIEAAPEFNRIERMRFRTYLGRPWRNYSRTVVMNSYLGDLISPQGWCEWDKYSNLDTVEYIEYGNSGPGADTTHRITWPGYRKNCTGEVAKQFKVKEFLHDADDWLQSTVFPVIARVT